ncbi:redoxin domain-containing protein [Fulvivirga sp. M361]|uniref:TlpA family protein disulfide reductase n=1 Tax=Fulvivirga sp. M361 TaxID=2594266 RepID=UPI00117BC409|nr:redoxin domain-containing protein [Fulvivirga sp. M361]TRX49846.1 redoxin domain-containing protein [Fulvivirga sp. M361]
MKKPIYISLVIILAGFCYLGFIAISKQITKNQHYEEALKIPSFSFYKLEGGFFSNDDLTNNGKVLIVYASPECVHCEEGAKLLANHKEAIQSLQVVIVFPFEAAEVQAFCDRVKGLRSIKNVSFLLDPFEEFRELFGYSNFPSFFVYDEKKLLIKKIEGISDIHQITDLIDS